MRYHSATFLLMMQNVNITMRILSYNALSVVELETSPLTFEGSRCWGQQRDPCRTLESYVFELDII